MIREFIDRITGAEADRLRSKITELLAANERAIAAIRHERKGNSDLSDALASAGDVAANLRERYAEVMTREGAYQEAMRVLDQAYHVEGELLDATEMGVELVAHPGDVVDTWIISLPARAVELQVLGRDHTRIPLSGMTEEEYLLHVARKSSDKIASSLAAAVAKAVGRKFSR